MLAAARDITKQAGRWHRRWIAAAAAAAATLVRVRLQLLGDFVVATCDPAIDAGQRHPFTAEVSVHRHRHQSLLTMLHSPNTRRRSTPESCSCSVGLVRHLVTDGRNGWLTDGSCACSSCYMDWILLYIVYRYMSYVWADSNTILWSTIVTITILEEHHTMLQQCNVAQCS